MTCRHAYNGCCILPCRHAVPHKRNEECKKYCKRMHIRTVCIEIELPSGAKFPEYTCGKQVTTECKGE